MIQFIPSFRDSDTLLNTKQDFFSKHKW